MRLTRGRRGGRWGPRIVLCQELAVRNRRRAGGWRCRGRRAHPLPLAFVCVRVCLLKGGDDGGGGESNCCRESALTEFVDPSTDPSLFPFSTHFSSRPPAALHRHFGPGNAVDEAGSHRHAGGLDEAGPHRDARPVDEAIARLRSAIDAAQMVTDSTADRIAHVLSPPSPKTSGDSISANQSGGSELAACLNGLADRIYQDTRARLDILNRLEL